VFFEEVAEPSYFPRANPVGLNDLQEYLTGEQSERQNADF
jgi:hypothetical protein